MLKAVREFWSVSVREEWRATGKILVEPDTQGSRLRISSEVRCWVAIRKKRDVRQRLREQA